MATTSVTVFSCQKGLIGFIPAIKKLIAELNEVLTDPATGESREFAGAEEQIAFVKGAIAKDNLAVLESLPARRSSPALPRP